MPAGGDRGIFEQAVQAWRGQIGGARGGLEIVVAAADRRQAETLQRCHPLVRVVYEAGANFSRQYDLAARAAEGDVLIFTEAHCLPRSDFLQRLEEAWQQESEAAGVTARIVPVCQNLLAEMDARLWHEGWQVLVPVPGEWRRFNIQGTALRRDIYLQLGGLPHRYDRFAEMVFAARLRDAGYRIAYSDRLVIDHFFRTNLREYLADIAAYVRGENAYRRQWPAGGTVNHTFIFPLPADAHKESLLREVLRAVLADFLRRGLWQRDGVSLRLLRYAWQLWSGLGWRLLRRYRWQFRGALLRCHLWRCSSRRLEPAYRALWPALSRFLRLQHLLRNPPPAADWPAHAYLSIAEWPEEHRFGFYELERADGRAFCWSGPLAALRLPAADRPRLVRLELLSSQAPPQLADLHAYWAGRRLGQQVVRYRPPELSLVLSPCPRPACLVLGRVPLQPRLCGSNDERLLGLPVAAISVEKAGSEPATRRWRAAA